MSFDLLIRGGTLIDGSRGHRRRADVGVRGGRIAAIGSLADARSAATIDAAGKIVAPGFIDVHNHSDGWLVRRPHFTAKTTQGFTTELLMSDGISYAPVDEHTARDWLFYLRSLDGLRLDEYRGWKSLADFLAVLDRRNVQNAAVQVPYANVRSLVCGFGRVAVDDFHQRQINAEIRRGMEAGAVGLSTGLDYIVQCFATTDELVDACRVVAEYGGVYVTHMRYKRGLMPALAEAVEIGRRSGVKVHISHLKAPSPAQAEEVLTWIDSVARNEVDFSFDVYPYQPGSTMLSYLLPYEAWEDGPLAAPGRLREPRLRALFRAGLETYRLDLDHLRIAWVAGKDNARHQGRRLSEYVAETGLPPDEALTNLLIEERFAVLLVFDEGDDALVRPFLAHDLYMMGTDGIYFDDGHVHPRVYGSAGRLLGPCVRDWKLFSLEDAVWKLSGRAAERFGLTGRGVLREGGFADVVVFDAETITDRATYDDPHQFTAGVEHVLVNGVPILANRAPIEAFDGDLPGRALRFNKR
ncbi:MAG TPA: D-aminoacylase [Planctomycetaceae bacterium]|nr:D-aminoacylase [Planctomycetaceae bacterium]